MKDLEKEVDEMQSFFIKRMFLFPEEDFSKYFIIFTYNYLDLGKDEKAIKAARQITKDYLINHYIEDLHYALNMRNKATRREASGLDATAMWEEAEFFLCGINEPVLNLLNQLKLEGSDVFLEQLKKETFLLDTKQEGLTLIN